MLLSKTTYVLLFLFLSLLGHEAFAQIVITESIITDRLGTTEHITAFETESGAGLQTLVDADGTNQTWDFSLINFTDSLQLEQSLISLPADLPGSDTPEFALAEFVEYTRVVEGTDTLKTLLFQSLDSGNLFSHGTVFVGVNDDGQQDTLITLASPPALDGVIPFEFEVTYSDSSSSIVNGVLEPTYVLYEVVADGWGTLVTPTQSAPALRVFNREMTYVTATGNLLSEFYSIDFISVEGITAEIELNELMQPVSASYFIVNTDMPTGNEITDTEIPRGFNLNQNYPNPFNPYTTISFEIHEAAQTTLKIFSLSGRLLDTLVDGFLPIGSYQIPFESEHLASGHYLYKMETVNSTQTRVMSLIK